MDRTDVMGGDFGVDLEAGAISCTEVGLLRDPGVEDQATQFVCSPNEGTAIGTAVTLTAKGSEMGETLSSAEKVYKENRKKSSNKKASKPPRPPRAPSLDAADQKLIKEIAELAMLKRARIERMKALKKEKNPKAASSASSGNAFALVFTVFFFLIILFQGCSRSTKLPVTQSEGSSDSPGTKLPVTQSEGSSESAGLLDKGVISIKYNPTLLASYENGPSYGRPSSTEQVNDRKLPHESNVVVC